MDGLLQRMPAWWRNYHGQEDQQADYRLLSTSENCEALEMTENGARKEGSFEVGVSSYLVPIWERVLFIMYALGVALAPSFARSQRKTTRTLHKTAWLDGLRGCASLFVVIHHSSVLWFPTISRGWGSAPGEYWFLQLPFIRLVHSGPAMVAIFFVISGFSLSYKSLGLMREARYSEVLASLSSSVLRRGTRLYVPPAVTTFFAMLASYMGWYGVGPGSRQPPQSPYLSEHLLSWWYSVIELSDPFRPAIFPGGYNPPYDTNLWTIPVEFYGSMVVFAVLLGLAKTYKLVRVVALGGLVIYLLYFAHSHLFLFISGAFLAALHHEREGNLNESQSITLDQGEKPSLPTWLSNRNWKLAKMIFWICSFICSLWVLSMPNMDFGGRTTPGYRVLASMLPQRYRGPYIENNFWTYIAAVCLVFIMDNFCFFQSIFTTRFAQFLGRISFGLYIVHGTLLYTLGWNVSAKALELTGSEPGLPYASGILLTAVLLYPLMFWTADVVARLVDAESVTFARWLSAKITVST